MTEQISCAAGDNHPPLYFLLLKVWSLAWGHSTEALRSLSALFGLLTILGTYALVRQIGTFNAESGDSCRWTQIAAAHAAALVAFSPFQIEWSQTVRMYSLATGLAAWSTWALVRALYSPSSNGWNWMTWSILAGGLLYTHYYGLFVVAAQFLFAISVTAVRLAKPDRQDELRRARNSLSALAAVALLWLPWHTTFLFQRQRAIAHGWTQPFSIEHIVNSVYQLFRLVWDGSSVPRIGAWAVAVSAAALSLGMLILGRKAERLLGLIVIVTFTLAIASSATGRLSVVGAQYFVIAQIFMFCTLAILVQRLPLQSLRVLGLSVTVGMSLWQCHQQIQSREERSRYPSFRAAVAYIESQRGPDEPILVARPRVLITASPHVTHPDRIFVLAKGEFFPFNEGTAVVSDAEYVTREWVAILNVKRIWVLDSTSIRVSMPAEWVDVSEERFNDWTWGELTVRQYERRDTLRRPSGIPGHDT